MTRFKKILKWFLLTILGLALLVFAFGYWFMSLIPKSDPEHDIRKTHAQSLPYLSQDSVEARGRILAVVTSTETMGSSGKATGYELTELSRAYYVFQANGFEVDIASPKGGQPPVIIDDEDMGEYDYAFLNDPDARQKTGNTLAMAEVDTSRYEAIYFVGGKGAMYDFPDDPYIQAMISAYGQSGKVIGAVCHGPAALVNVSLKNGTPLLAGRSVSGFTNQEELFLIPDAAEIFPFLLEDRLMKSGANFKEGTMYLENVVHDQNLITGQNPWSTWKLAETMISQLGYEPKKRVITTEEHAVEVLETYHQQGYASAKQLISEMVMNEEKINRVLLAKHSILSAMQWDLAEAFQLVWLLKHVNDQID